MAFCVFCGQDTAATRSIIGLIIVVVIGLKQNLS